METGDALKAIVDKDFSAFKDIVKTALNAKISERKKELYNNCREQLKDRETLYKKD